MIQPLPLWRTVWRFFKKLKIELPYDPVIPFVDIYPEKNMVRKDTCTTMLTEALSTTARTRTQPSCLATEDVHTHGGILLSHEKEWNDAICSNANGLRDHHSK